MERSFLSVYHNLKLLKKTEYNQELSSTPLQFSLPETISCLARTCDVTAGPTLLIMGSFWTGGRRTGRQDRPPGQAEAASPALGIAHVRSDQKFVGYVALNTV